MVFPARAGMIRRGRTPDVSITRIPRESGDDPYMAQIRGIRTAYSPRERG